MVPIHAASSATIANAKRETIDSFVGFASGRNYPRWPLETFLEISNVCNLKCAMCPTFSALNPHRFAALKMSERGFIDSEKISHKLETILEHTLNVHCFGYGEPTIHPDFREFLSFIARYEVLIDFFTNGMYLEQELAQFLVDQRIASVTISFSGLTKEEYENVYLGGVYQRVLDGIEALANAKVRSGSSYPLIEINSLSFEHHVSKLDQFVDFMADRGANVIHLKALQPHAFIPQLAGHGSVLRSWKEGEVLRRAHERANARGVVLSSTQYVLAAVNSDEEWRAAKARQGLELSADNEDFHGRLVAIGGFKAATKEIDLFRPATGKVPSDTEIYHVVTAENLAAHLDIRPLPSKAAPFYCMEPFKTMYVRRNGFVKPCCFSDDLAPALGTVYDQDGGDVWSGERYDLVRQSILQQRYPMTACGSCLREQIGPQHHYAHAKVESYLSWYKTVVGEELMESPVELLQALGDNAEIAARFLRHHPQIDADAARADRLEVVAQTEIFVEEDLGSSELIILKDLVAQRLATGQALSGVVEGHLDAVEGRKLRGWIWSPMFPEQHLTVLVYDFAHEIGVCRADRFRGDLLVAGKNRGIYAFELTLPERLFDGNTHAFRAKLRGTDFWLRAQPLYVSLPRLSAPPSGP